VLQPPNISLFDAFHQPNQRGAAGAASAVSADVLNTPQYPALPPIAAINNGKHTVKAESSVDSVTIMSPPRCSVACSCVMQPDVFSASTSYKCLIAQVLDENFMPAGSSQKHVKVEGPIIDVSSSSEPASPASSGSSSGMEELTNTPTRLHITASAARALVKRGLHSHF